MNHQDAVILLRVANINRGTQMILEPEEEEFLRLICKR